MYSSWLTLEHGVIFFTNLSSYRQVMWACLCGALTHNCAIAGIQSWRNWLDKSWIWWQSRMPRPYWKGDGHDWMRSTSEHFQLGPQISFELIHIQLDVQTHVLTHHSQNIKCWKTVCEIYCSRSTQSAVGWSNQNVLKSSSKKPKY